MEGEKRVRATQNGEDESDESDHGIPKVQQPFYRLSVFWNNPHYFLIPEYGQTNSL